MTLRLRDWDNRPRRRRPAPGPIAIRPARDAPGAESLPAPVGPGDGPTAEVLDRSGVDRPPPVSAAPGAIPRLEDVRYHLLPDGAG
ncbi:hypothetical protein ACQPYE_17205 [Actinosynnema sp. CA-299493]